MSYSKKDEDGDAAIMKVDRTSVFQEGAHEAPLPPSPKSHLTPASTIVQFLSHPTQKMSSSSHQDCPPSLHRGTISYQRSHDAFLWHLKAFPEQRCQFTTDGPSHYQGVGAFRRGYYYGHKYNHEGYWWWNGCDLQTQCYTRLVPYH